MYINVHDRGYHRSGFVIDLLRDVIHSQQQSPSTRSRTMHGPNTETKRFKKVKLHCTATACI